MFFGQATHEVGGDGTLSSGYPTWRQGFYYVTEIACTPSYGDESCDYKSDNWSADAWPPQDGVQYYGRGPFQLSWNYNYGQFSQVLTGDPMTLLENPDLVAQDGYTALVSALWFYMTPQAPKPSIHEIATRLYVPNAHDEANGLGPHFGASTMVINGGLECTTSTGIENWNSQKRINYYTEFLNYFGLPAESNMGCATMKPFDTNSSSNYPASLDKNWGEADTCKIVTWYTQYSIFRDTDYKRCVCSVWEPTLAGCLDGALSSTDEPTIEQE